MLQLRMLKNITGLSWSAVCKDCSFYRSNITWSPDPPGVVGYRCLQHHYVFNGLSPWQRLLNNTYFHYQCKVFTSFYKTEYPDRICKLDHSYLNETHHTNSCWRELMISSNTISIVGAIGMVFNFVVFLTILS